MIFFFISIQYLNQPVSPFGEPLLYDHYILPKQRREQAGRVPRAARHLYLVAMYRAGAGAALIRGAVYRGRRPGDLYPVQYCLRYGSVFCGVSVQWAVR